MPILAVISELEKRGVDLDKIIWIGGNDSLEEKMANQAGVNFFGVAVGKFRRYFSGQNFLDFFRVPVGIFQAIKIINDYRPAVVFSKGGYVSVPTVIAGWFFNQPIILHESDVSPGLANRWLGRLASKVFLTFPGSEKYFSTKVQKKCQPVGAIIRADILAARKEEGFIHFNLDRQKTVILIAGGSQGSVKINQNIWQIVDQILALGQVIHIVGEKNLEEARKLSEENNWSSRGYRFFSFLDGPEMAQAYAIADLFVGRAGSALAEVAAWGVPGVVIPYAASAAGHQQKNAEFFARIGGVKVFEEAKLEPAELGKLIKELINDQPERAKMSAAMRSLKLGQGRIKAVNSIINMAAKK